MNFALYLYASSQATLAPPVTGKMVKGLLMCYAVIFVTFYSAAVSGYWVFGNKSNSNTLKSLLPDDGPALAPTWVLGMGVVFVLLQLFAIGLVITLVVVVVMYSFDWNFYTHLQGHGNRSTLKWHTRSWKANQPM